MHSLADYVPTLVSRAAARMQAVLLGAVTGERKRPSSNKIIVCGDRAPIPDVLPSQKDFKPGPGAGPCRLKHQGHSQPCDGQLCMLVRRIVGIKYGWRTFKLRCKAEGETDKENKG